MANQGDTAQCFICKTTWKNGAVYSMKDLNFNKGYYIEVGKHGWQVDERESNCLRNYTTGQKYCNTRC